MLDWFRNRWLSGNRTARIEPMQRESLALLQGLEAKLAARIDTASSQRFAELERKLGAAHPATDLTPLTTALTAMQDQCLAMTKRLEELSTRYGEQNWLRSALDYETQRGRSLAEQTGHLLNTLAEDRRNLQQAEARAAAGDAARTAADVLKAQLQALRAEHEALLQRRPGSGQ